MGLAGLYGLFAHYSIIDVDYVNHAATLENVKLFPAMISSNVQVDGVSKMSSAVGDGRGREIGIGGIFKIGFAKYDTRLSPSPRSTEAENARAAFKISKNRPQIAADRQLPRGASARRH